MLVAKNSAVGEADRVASGDAGPDLGLDAPALALASCYNGSLADATTTKVQPLALVLSGLLSADVGFVDFDNPASSVGSLPQASRSR